ncbi:MAG: ABC transporter permease [Bacteroidota bacterium]
MKLTGIALRNIRRKKGKAAFLVAGLAIGVATVMAIVSISAAMKTEIAKKLDEYGANIIVVPESNDLSVSYGGFVVAGMSLEERELDEQALALIRTVKNKDSLNVLAPKLFGAVQVEGRQAVIAGVDFDAELRIKRWWELMGESPAGPDDLLLGYQAALKLKKMPGDTLVIGGKPMRVAGILKETGGSEDSLVMAGLPVVQRMLGKPGKLSMIEVSAYCLSCPIEELTKQIRGVLPGTKVTALMQAAKAREENLTRFNNFAYSVGVIVLLIGGLVVGVTMMGSVVERVREIGVFRAVGFRRSHVMAVILAEAGALGAVGGFLGYGVGFAAAALFGQSVAQMQVQVGINLWLGLGSAVMAAILAILASLYPAWRAANLDPAEALRSI